MAIIGERKGMVVVTDPGDNPGSGGIADTPGVLQAVLGVDFDATCVFASFADAKHGIDFSEVWLLCVKAKNHFRAAFLPLSSAIIDIDAPGPAALNLSSLPFRHAPGVAPD